MPRMRKLVRSMFKSPSSRAGRSPKGDNESLSNRLNINDEYKEAFRTRSYVDMWNEVRGPLGKRSLDEVDRLSPSPSSSAFDIHLSDHLYEPQQRGTRTEMIESFKSHQLLADYFVANLELCNICEFLLRCIHQMRANNRKIKRAIELSKRVQDSGDYTDDLCGAICTELAAFALLRNPLSLASPVQFLEVHDNNMVLLHKLTSEKRRIRRRAKFSKICKKVGEYGLMASHTALAISLVLFVLQSMVGIVAAPVLLGYLFCAFRKNNKVICGGFNEMLPERLYSQLDLAAKGTYILINDFDTLSSLVRRLYDETEHRKALADMCVRHKKTELLKEVLKELHMHHSCYLEQILEIERHIYLCFHTINRCRRLVIRETMVDQQ